MSKWQTELEARPECVMGRYHWWCLARYGAEYMGEFDKPKIVYPQIMMAPRFTLDSDNTYTNQKCFIICTAEPFLLGLLNSASVWGFLASRVVTLGDAESRGRIEPRREDVSAIPIPRASDADRAAIAALAQKCLDANGKGCAAWEKEIDERVAALYGLDPADFARKGPAAR